MGRGRGLRVARDRGRRELSRARRALALLTPGVVDAGLSSVGTFVTAVFAARVLSISELGVYGIVFSAMVVARLVPHQLIFVPHHVRLVSAPRASRVRGALWSVRPALVAALLAATLIPAVAVIFASEVDTSTWLAIVSTASLAAIIGPVYDHLRSTLHLAELSWLAAIVSAVQIVAVVTGIVVLSALDVHEAAIPLLALDLAMLAAISAGLVLGWARSRGVSAPEPPELRQLLREGSPILGSRLIDDLVRLAGPMVIGLIVSAEAAGQLEATRVVAQPLFVLALGFTQVLGPRLVDASQRRAAPRARRTSFTYAGAMIAAGAIYLLVAGWDHPLNPMALMVPVAYTASGLAALRIVANTMIGLRGLFRSLMLGLGNNRELVRVASYGSLVGVAAMVSLAGPTGAYALPLAEVAAWPVRTLLLYRSIVAGFATPAPAAPLGVREVPSERS